jgi:hypothetical protein
MPWIHYEFTLKFEVFKASKLKGGLRILWAREHKLNIVENTSLSYILKNVITPFQKTTIQILDTHVLKKFPSFRSLKYYYRLDKSLQFDSSLRELNPTQYLIRYYS